MTEYITSLGKRIEFVPIGPLLDKLFASLPEIKPPTYKIKTATGVDEEWPLVEQAPKTDAEWDALIERKESDENKQAVRQYRADLAARQATYNMRLMRLILTRGVKVEIPDDDDWIEEQKFIGMTVPDDSRERRVHYIETEVLGTTNDYQQLVVGVFKTSEVSEEAIAQFEAAFQHSMEERRRATASRSAA